MALEDSKKYTTPRVIKKHAQIAYLKCHHLIELIKKLKEMIDKEGYLYEQDKFKLMRCIEGMNSSCIEIIDGTNGNRKVIGKEIAQKIDNIFAECIDNKDGLLVQDPEGIRYN